MLDACLEKSFTCGGWCPDGRKSEDGTIDTKYPLLELSGADYIDRTLKNVEDSDATIVIYAGELQGGTLASVEFAKAQRKPVLLVNTAEEALSSSCKRVLAFIEQNRLERMNWSGPRASEWGKAYSTAKRIALEVIGALKNRV